MTKLLIFGIGVLIFSSLLYCISLFVAKWKGTYEEEEVCFSDEDILLREYRHIININ